MGFEGRSPLRILGAILGRAGVESSYERSELETGDRILSPPHCEKLNLNCNIMKKIKLGTYKHYKGGKYEVIGVAKHSETLEDVVVYKHPGNELSELWVRPLTMFLEKIIIDGKEVSRFEHIEK